MERKTKKKGCERRLHLKEWRLLLLLSWAFR
jgi:hypothetical protein